MSHQINILSGANKTSIYESLLPQIKYLIKGENNLVANLANISAALYQSFH